MLLGEWFVRLLVVYSTTIGTWWGLNDAAHSCWRCYLNEDAGMYQEHLDGRQEEFAAGCIYLLPHYMPIRAGCRLRRVRHSYIHFVVMGLPQVVLQEMFNQRMGFPTRPDLAERMRHICQPVAPEEPAERYTRECEVKSLVYELLAEYLRAVPNEQRARSLRLAKLLEPVLPAIQHIDTYLHDRLRVADLASLCFMSEDYFIRQFHRLVGRTPIHYIQRQRVERAAQQLLFSNRSIDQIAEETGFGNRYNFSRVFKQHTQTSPALYRRTGTLYKSPDDRA